MSQINILPENLINQIAAGEVVERPASVVKELVENAIDAGSDKIVVEITGAGDEMIKVTDNGCGMDKEDALLSLERHATSKIQGLKDLSNINTMGFRGEALASIASVSHLNLRTVKNVPGKSDLPGTLISSEGGEITKNEEIAWPQGTQIEIINLFYNTPARKKYLKSPGVEYNQILQIMQQFAIIHPEIHFTFIRNEKKVFEYTKTDSWEIRLQNIFGEETVKDLLPVFYESGNLKIRGFIGKPTVNSARGKHQYLFVNNRQIIHKLFNYIVTESYHSLLMNDEKPFFVLNVQINPDLVDVNVHPRKTEVRFVLQNELISALKRSVKATLEKNILVPNFENPSSQTFVDIGTGNRYKGEYKVPNVNPMKVQDAMSFTEEFTKPSGDDRQHQDLQQIKNLSLRPITQIANSYILAENEEGLLIIDQHAAHERILYEKFMKEYEEKETRSQKVLVPGKIDLTPSEKDVLENNMEIFKKLGFDIEPFGGNTFIIQAVPESLGDEDSGKVVKEVIDDISENKNVKGTKDANVKIIEYMACRTAIKFGKKLTYEEMVSLISQMDKLKLPYHCPHGRPSIVSITYDDLEKKFKRK